MWLILLGILGLLLVAGGAGAGGAYLTVNWDRITAKSEPVPLESKGQLVPLPRFLTDLADRDRRRYVDVTLTLLVSDEAAAKDALAQMPVLRDTVLGFLRSQGAAELLGATGKERLGEALVQVVGPVVAGGVRRVYVTDLLIQ